MWATGGVQPTGDKPVVRTRSWRASAIELPAAAGAGATTRRAARASVTLCTLQYTTVRLTEFS